MVIVVGMIAGTILAVFFHAVFFSDGDRRRKPESGRFALSSAPRPPPSNATELAQDRQAERQKRSEVERCLEAAKRGDINAQAMMGTFYYRGEGVEKNTAKAEMWWKMAAQQGHPGAKHNLAAMRKPGQS
jgi:TPR repeat protein